MKRKSSFFIWNTKKTCALCSSWFVSQLRRDWDFFSCSRLARRYRVYHMTILVFRDENKITYILMFRDEIETLENHFSWSSEKKWSMASLINMSIYLLPQLINFICLFFYHQWYISRLFGVGALCVFLNLIPSRAFLPPLSGHASSCPCLTFLYYLPGSSLIFTFLYLL